MVAADGSQTLRQAIAHHHINTNRMNKFLHFGIDCCACRREEMSPFQTQFLSYQREHRLIQHLVFQMKSQRRALTLRQIVDIMTLTHTQRMQEQLTLRSIGLLYLLQHTHIHLLPETGN